MAQRSWPARCDTKIRECEQLIQSAAASEETASAETQKAPIRLIVADDHAMFRESLCALMKLNSGFEVIAEAPDGKTAVELTRTLKPDLLLLDLSMPGMGGVEVLRELHSHQAGVGIIVLCAAITREQTVEVMQLGARGIILKTEPIASLIECMSKVRQGDYWIEKDCLANLVQATADAERAKKIVKNKYGLTPRENDIVAAALEGCSNAEIAEKLALSEQTVKHHMSHVFEKLGVFSRVELALFAVNHRILDD